MPLPFLMETSTIEVMRIGKVALNGVNPTPVKLIASTQAAIGGAIGPFNIANGLTFIANVDSRGAQTATFSSAAGTSVSAGSPSLDISAGTATTFKVAVDGGAAQAVTLVVAGLNSGALIAAAMQAGIRALGGAFANVTVVYTTVYTITSGTKGTGSSVVITAGAANDVAAALKIGAANAGVETAGTGFAANAGAATIAEVLAVIVAAITYGTITNSGGATLITSKHTGSASTIVLGSGTANSALGFTNSATALGAQGLGHKWNMSDANYIVQLTNKGVAAASLAALDLSVTDEAVDGFNIQCETTSATNNVNILIIGKSPEREN